MSEKDAGKTFEWSVNRKREEIPCIFILLNDMWTKGERERGEQSGKMCCVNPLKYLLKLWELRSKMRQLKGEREREKCPRG